MKEYSAVLPLKIFIPKVRAKDKVYWLSMNNYHTWHPQVRNLIKQAFEPILFDSWGFPAEKIEVSYFVQREKNIRFDTMNYISLVDKFFMDWLQSHGLLVDDDFSRVCYGSIDGSNGMIFSAVNCSIKII